MKRFCAWVMLAVLLALVALPAFAAETSPWQLSGEEKPRREDLGKVPAFPRERSANGVGAFPRWIRQARINGYYINLRLYAPDGSGILFQERLAPMEAGVSELRLFLRQKTTNGGLMLQCDEKALKILEAYNIREIVVADAEYYLQATYSVSDLSTLRKAFSLRPGEQLCLSGENDPVMVVSESGNRRVVTE